MPRQVSRASHGSDACPGRLVADRVELDGVAIAEIVVGHRLDIRCVDRRKRRRRGRRRGRGRRGWRGRGRARRRRIGLGDHRTGGPIRGRLAGVTGNERHRRDGGQPHRRGERAATPPGGAAACRELACQAQRHVRWRWCGALMAVQSAAPSERLHFLGRALGIWAGSLPGPLLGGISAGCCQDSRPDGFTAAAGRSSESYA